MGKIQANIGGTIQTIRKVQANIGGVITNIKKVQANIGGVIQTIWQAMLYNAALDSTYNYTSGTGVFLINRLNKKLISAWGGGICEVNKTTGEIAIPSPTTDVDGIELFDDINGNIFTRADEQNTGNLIQKFSPTLVKLATFKRPSEYDDGFITFMVGNGSEIVYGFSCRLYGYPEYAHYIIKRSNNLLNEISRVTRASFGSGWACTSKDSLYFMIQQEWSKRRFSDLGVVWTHTPPAGVNYWGGSYLSDGSVVLLTIDAHLYKLNANGGFVKEVAMPITYNEYKFHAVDEDDNVYFGASEFSIRQIYKYDKDLNLIWQLNLPDVGEGAVVDSDYSIYIGTKKIIQS